MTALATDFSTWEGLGPDRFTSESMVRDLTLDVVRPVGLKRLVAEAELMHRTDRKYIAPVEKVAKLVSEIGDTHRVLAIKGRRYTTYRTLYFDTADLTSARAHVQGRRQRWKVRTRLYVEDGLCRVEVKTKDNRENTVKVMGVSDPATFGALRGNDRRFVNRHLKDFPGIHVRDLVPTAEVHYARATLTDLKAGTRVTLDWGLSMHLDGGDTWLDDGYVMVETKGPGPLTRVDRTLHDLGVRPRGFSKYVAAAASTSPGIAANDFASLRSSGILNVRAMEF